MAITEKNYGLVRKDTGVAALTQIPIPTLKDDYILVRTQAIALNPTDWTTLDAPGDTGTLVGCDYAGIVEEVGKKVSKNFKKGDRIAGFAHGGNDSEPQYGAFAKFIVVKGDIQLHVPDHVRFEVAASVASGVVTTCYGLYNVLGLPPPGVPSSVEHHTDAPLLIFGGSTATGTIAIQFAKLSGQKVITTCSPMHFDLVKSRGADEVFDYHDADTSKNISGAAGGRLFNVFDTVAVESSAKICADAIGPEGGKYCNLLGIDCPRSDVKSLFFLGYSMAGESYIFEKQFYPAQPEDFDFARKYIQIAEKLWAEGKWEAHPQRIGSGGLLGALDGMQQMREGKVRGFKLVYRTDDTTWG